MAVGKVKWFSAEKERATMFLFISRLFSVTVIKLSTRDRMFPSTLSRVSVDRRQLT